MDPRTAMPAAEPVPVPALSVTRLPLRPRARASVLLATALLGLFLAGCGGQATSRTSDSGVSGSGGAKSCAATKTADGLTITLAASPCPLHGGKSAKARITVKDGGGKPVEGATVKVSPEMSSMKMKGGNQTAASDGEGYTARLVLGMPGDWTVDVQVEAPGQDKTSSVAFDLTAE